MEPSAERTAERIEELKGRCRSAGRNITPQRIAVYRALLESPDHPTPDALYEIVRREMPSISLATIYKSLDALQDLGVVREVFRLGDARRFDANLDRHQHLVCTECGRVDDFYDTHLGELRPPESTNDFTAREVSVNILGRCSLCAAMERPDDEI